MAVKSAGTTLAFTHNGASVTVGKLSSISELKCDSEALDVTTLDAPEGCRTYVQGFKDCGEVTLEGYLEDDEGQAALISRYQSGSSAPFVITFPDETKASFSAFVKSYSLGAAQVDGAVGFGAVLRLTGGVSVT